MKCVFGSHVPMEKAGEGVSRKVLVHDEDLMVVEVHFEEGGIGALHRHVHEQATYVVAGRFEFTNDGEQRIVGPGDSLLFAPNVLHGTRCLEKGVLIDIFTPVRQDFLS